MKRLIAVFLILITLLTLCACTGNGKGSYEETYEEELLVSPEELLVGRWNSLEHTKNEESVDNAIYEMYFYDDGSCEFYCESVLLKSWYWSCQESESAEENVVYGLRSFEDGKVQNDSFSLKYNKKNNTLILDIMEEKPDLHQFVFVKSEEKIKELTFDSLGIWYSLTGEWRADTFLSKTDTYCFVKELAENYVLKFHDDFRVYYNGEYTAELTDLGIKVKRDEPLKRLVTDDSITVLPSDEKCTIIYDLYTETLIIKYENKENKTTEYTSFVRKDTEMTGAELGERVLMNAYGSGVEFIEIYNSSDKKTYPASETKLKPDLKIFDDGTYKFTLNGEKYFGTWNERSESVLVTPYPGVRFFKYGIDQLPTTTLYYQLRVYSMQYTRIQLYLQFDDSLYLILYFE